MNITDRTHRFMLEIHTAELNKVIECVPVTNHKPCQWLSKSFLFIDVLYSE